MTNPTNPKTEGNKMTNPTNATTEKETTEKETTEKAEKAETKGKAEKAEKAETKGKAETTEKAEKAETKGKAEKAEKAETKGKAETKEKAEKAKTEEKAETTEEEEFKKPIYKRSEEHQKASDETSKGIKDALKIIPWVAIDGHEKVKGFGKKDLEVANPIFGSSIPELSMVLRSNMPLRFFPEMSEKRSEKFSKAFHLLKTEKVEINRLVGVVINWKKKTPALVEFYKSRKITGELLQHKEVLEFLLSFWEGRILGECEISKKLEVKTAKTEKKEAKKEAKKEEKKEVKTVKVPSKVQPPKVKSQKSIK